MPDDTTDDSATTHPGPSADGGARPPSPPTEPRPGAGRRRRLEDLARRRPDPAVAWSPRDFEVSLARWDGEHELFRCQDWAALLAHRRRRFERDPADPEARALLAEALALTGRPEEAVRLLATVDRDHPACEDVRRRLRDAGEAAADPEEAHRRLVDDLVFDRLRDALGPPVEGPGGGSDGGGWRRTEGETITDSPVFPGDGC